MIFATHNRHKANEIQAILRGKFRILSLDQLQYLDPVPEDKNTLEENALQKAWHVYDIFRKDCFADDTGLEVECLNGAPGVYSARYAEMTGEKGEREEVSGANIRKLLEQMKGETHRKARFRTVIALIIGEKDHFFEGIVDGSIMTGKHGNMGFGYDPVFRPDGYTQTFAEMSLSEKNDISHRARAITKLVEFLQEVSIQ